MFGKITFKQGDSDKDNAYFFYILISKINDKILNSNIPIVSIILGTILYLLCFYIIKCFIKAVPFPFAF